MSWLGAGIGAGIGFAVGGPIGAAIGLWIGSSIGRSSSKTTLKQKNQTLFFVSIFSMLAKMAKSDGIVTQDEIDYLTSFMKNLRLDAEDTQVAMQIFRNAKSDAYSIYDYADQYATIANIEMRKMIYATLWNVAYADGVIHKNEDEILRKIPNHLGLHSGIYYEFNTESQSYGQPTQAQSNIDKYYEILGCSSDATDDEIKRCYRRAITEYHPDKIQSKGLPKEFMKFANDQTIKINEAYNVIKESRKN